jgi:hypothetical protein
MRERVIFPYTTCNSERIDAYRFSPSGLRISIGDDDVPVQRSEQDYTYVLPDFLPDQDWLRIRYSFFIHSVRAMFQGPRAITMDDATLGIALKWESKDSLQWGISSHVLVNFDSPPSEQYELALEFSPGMLRGDLFLAPILLLATPSAHPIPDYANTAGSYLGQLDSTIRCIVDGHGSIFPIVEYQGEPTDPLWNIRLDYTDPLEDQFHQENCALEINLAHPDARLIGAEERKDSLTPLAKEVITEFIAAIIIDLRYNSHVWNEVIRGDGAPGSVAAAVYHIFHDNNVLPDNPATILKSVRASFEMTEQSP